MRRIKKLDPDIWTCSSCGNLNKVQYFIEIEGFDVDSLQIGVITQSTILFLLFL